MTVTGEIFAIGGFILLGLCAVLLLKEFNTGAAVCAGAACACGILLRCIYLLSQDRSFTGLIEAVNGMGFGTYAAILLKALGISYIASFCEELCRHTGQTLLAYAAGVAGKAGILLLCLPMAAELLGKAADML